MIRLAHHALRHPRLWTIFTGLATLLVGSGILRLQMRTDGGALRPPHHPVVVATNDDEVRFQDPRQVVLLVSARPGEPSLSSPDGFRFLRQLDRELRELPAVRADALLSLASVPRLLDGADGFSLGTYLDEIPDDPVAFEALVGELRELELTNGTLLSADGQQAAIYIPLSEQRQDIPRQVTEVETWSASRPPGPFELRLTGPQMAETTLGRMVLRDLRVLIPLMVAVIAVLLLLTLGTLGGMLVPLAEALLVLTWTMGIMGWTGVPVTLVTTILPVLLMAMSITDEIHLLERLQSHLTLAPVIRAADGAQPAKEAMVIQRAVEAALEDVARPIVGTSVTTALGFLSFLSATMVPLRHFGLFAAMGILLAMVLSFCSIPALIVLMPRSWFVPRWWGKTPAVLGDEPRRIDVLGTWAFRHPSTAFGVGLLVVAASVPGITRLHVQDAWMDNFSPNSPLVTAERDYNAAFWGSYRLDVVMEGDRDLFYRPEGAALMEEFRTIARLGPHVGGVLTYLDPLTEVARSLGEDTRLSSMDPIRLGDIATVAEMSENRLRLRQLITESGAAARARLFVNSPNYAKARELQAYLDLHLPARAHRHGIEFHTSGDLPVATVMVESIVRNQLRSIAWTLLTVACVLLLVFAKGRGTLVALMPVSAAAIVLLGGMGYTGMPLGIATSMFASLTLGVGVDFGLHFLHRYRRERSQGRDHTKALSATVGKTGRAVLWNAVVLALGFLVLTRSSLKPNHSLGILLAAAICACYVSTLLFMPRLLRWAGLGLALCILPWLYVFQPSSARADDSPCPAASEASARQLMADLEAGFRRNPRLVRMHIATRYGESHGLSRHFQDRTEDKVLWGIFNGDTEQTWLMYVFSGPGRLAGTTLLMKDFAQTDLSDSMWLYLRSFDRLRALDQRSYRVMVPGTALTYEDSRGFLPLDKYDFRPADLSKASDATDSATDTQSKASAATDSATDIQGCPRTPELRENLGYDSLLLRVDLDKRMVRRVEYRNLAGQLLKTYVVAGEIQLEDQWFPTEVRLEHHTQGFVTTILYEHWLLPGPLDAAMFRPDVEEKTFLERLRDVATAAGLGERITEEIAEADQRVREYEERMRKRLEETPEDDGEEPSSQGRS